MWDPSYQNDHEVNSKETFGSNENTIGYFYPSLYFHNYII